MNSSKNLVPDILTEFIEIAVHNILRIRQLYPDNIFLKKQKYGVTVYQAMHPQLKEYISNCMQAVHYLAKERQLSKIVVCFLKTHNVIEEKVIFNVSGIDVLIDKDPYLLDIEKKFRSFLTRLHTINDYVKPLSRDATFAIQIHTTESGGIAYMDNPIYQNFPWMQVETSFSAISNAEIVPLETFTNDIIDMQIYIEKKV